MRAGTPFVFVSGYGRESLPPAFAHIDIIGKPFTVEQVIAAAQSIVTVENNVTQLKAVRALS